MLILVKSNKSFYEQFLLVEVLANTTTISFPKLRVKLTFYQ